MTTTEPSTSEPVSETDRNALLLQYQTVRAATERLCDPLVVEDYVVQSMPDASPAKWHLAHTSWFFETFVLSKWSDGYRLFDEAYEYLFNSYYNAVGPQFSRPRRGLLSRPTVEQTYAYRAHVDESMAALLTEATPDNSAQFTALLELGLNHEQQHQELILSDIKHVLSVNPTHPVYRPAKEDGNESAPPVQWQAFPAAQRWIGHEGSRFAYDNETPRHRVYVEAFQLASRLVTNGEYLAFMADGGYERPELWLSDGWSVRCENNWTAPLYWEQHDDRWLNFTLGGMREVELAAPVCHVSYYEADAYARWANAWLPTEAAWEIAACDLPVTGVFAEDAAFGPRAATSDSDQRLMQMYGDVWEWTCSPYVRYPRFRPPSGALGEYNAKFMSNQLVLRGGSCATPRSHIRSTYRNFFPPHARWQFSGFRLSREAQ
jgi:ergothioneine biosynthesis protein EgtB